MDAQRPEGSSTAVIVPLGRVVPQRLGELVDLDARLRQDLADMYSEEAWKAENFRVDRPGKWSHSFAAFHEQTDSIVGFWVASLADDTAVHVHRVGVSPDARRAGVGRDLFLQARAAGDRLGVERMTLLVAESNTGAVNFYGSLGFSVLRGRELEEAATLRGWSTDPNASVVIRHRRRLLFLEYPLEMGSSP